MCRSRTWTTTTARSVAARRPKPSRRRGMMLLSQVARVVSGRPSRPLASETVTGVSTDSRSIRAGDLFFALRGANFDAHDFLAQAFEKGAAAAIVDKDIDSPGLAIRVGDTLGALGTLAAAYRMTLGA